MSKTCNTTCNDTFIASTTNNGSAGHHLYHPGRTAVARPGDRFFSAAELICLGWTLLLLFGFLLGPSGFDLLPGISEHWFPLIADMALLMVSFLMGGKLSFSHGHGNVKWVFWISLSEVLVTATVLAAGLWLVGLPLIVALLLAGIGTATDPAATADVIDEAGASGPLSKHLGWSGRH